ncbi:hypothetical protein BDF19DRAFT_446309 [Syncephalis fuscata]|nr:hypothetical protein BDF19DRAFT_446309 [Syncephalis fuscata]
MIFPSYTPKQRSFGPNTLNNLYNVPGNTYISNGSNPTSTLTNNQNDIIRTNNAQSTITKFNQESIHAELLTRTIRGLNCPPFTLSSLRSYMIRENFNVALLDFLSWHQEFAHRFFQQVPMNSQQVMSPYTGTSTNSHSNQSQISGSLKQSDSNSNDRTFLKESKNKDRFIYLGLVGVASPAAIDELNGSLQERLLQEREMLASMAENLSNIPNINSVDYNAEDPATPDFFYLPADNNTDSSENAVAAQQPYRRFCEQSYAYFIAPKSKLPLTTRQRAEIRRLLDCTIHPALFSIAVHRCYYAIVTDVIPGFLRGGAKNLTLVLPLLTLTSLAIAIWMIFSISNRWIRLTVAPVFCLGVWAIIQGSGGVCVLMALVGKRSRITESHSDQTPSNGNDNYRAEVGNETFSNSPFISGVSYSPNRMCNGNSSHTLVKSHATSSSLPGNTSSSSSKPTSSGIFNLEPQLRILIRMLNVAFFITFIIFCIIVAVPIYST